MRKLSHDQSPGRQEKRPCGFALLSALALLSLLALLGAFFASMAALDLAASENSLLGAQEDFLLLSSAEHLQALLKSAQKPGAPAFPILGESGPHPVRDSAGQTIGSYSLRIRPLKSPLSQTAFWNGKAWEPRLSPALDSLGDLVKAMKRADPGPGSHGRALSRALLLSDLADENNCPQKRAGLYGIEALDFEEILGDDGSQLRFCYRCSGVYGKDRAVLSLPYYFGQRDYDHMEPLDQDRPQMRETFSAKAARAILKDSIKLEGPIIRLGLEKEPLQQEGGSLYQDWGRKSGRLFPAKGLWRNASLCLFGYAAPGLTPLRTAAIKDSDLDGLALGYSRELFNQLTNGAIRYAQIRGFVHSETLYAERGGLSLWLRTEGLRPATAYDVALQDCNFKVPYGDSQGGLGRCQKLEAETENGKEEVEARGLAFPLAKPVASNGEGALELTVTSPMNASTKRRLRLQSLYLRRPDIVALANHGPSALPLCGHSLVIQSGDGPEILGLIPPEAILPPQARFYLSTSPLLAQEIVGTSKSSLTAEERIFPLLEWGGPQYCIEEIYERRLGEQFETRLVFKGASWPKDALKGEIVEFSGQRQNGEALPPDGLRYQIEGGNAKNSLVFPNLRLATYAGLRKGDRMRILGLPARLDCASLSLRNQYGRIVARSGEMAPCKIKGASQRKVGRLWKANSSPFKEQPALEILPFPNGALASWRQAAALCDSGEFRRMAQLEENSFSKSPALTLKALDFSVCGAFHTGGWQKAYGNFSPNENSLAQEGALWPEDFFAGQLLKILKGPQKGETFAITSSAPSSVSICSRSCPGLARMKKARAINAALGPGYKEAFYTACKEGETGIFIFSNFFGLSGSRLYAKGLQDAIRTSEFLEENHGALMEFRIFDWEKKAFGPALAFRYGENDCHFLCLLEEGMISREGLLKLSLTARGLKDPMSSGRAWFGGLAAVPRAQVTHSPFYPAASRKNQGLFACLTDIEALQEDSFASQEELENLAWQYLLEIEIQMEGTRDPSIHRRLMNIRPSKDGREIKMNVEVLDGERL